MKTILKTKNFYILRFDLGEKLISQLKNFVQQEKIASAFFIGLGAVQRAELAFYDLKTKKYLSKKFTGGFEVANLTGNIAQADAEPVIHCHITLADKNFKTVAGHLNEAVVAGTIEIFLIPSQNKILRKTDFKTGLKLME